MSKTIKQEVSEDFQQQVVMTKIKKEVVEDSSSDHYEPRNHTSPSWASQHSAQYDTSCFPSPYYNQTSTYPSPMGYSVPTDAGYYGESIYHSPQYPPFDECSPLPSYSSTPQKDSNRKSKSEKSFPLLHQLLTTPDSSKKKRKPRSSKKDPTTTRRRRDTKSPEPTPAQIKLVHDAYWKSYHEFMYYNCYSLQTPYSTPTYEIPYIPEDGHPSWFQK